MEVKRYLYLRVRVCFFASLFLSLLSSQSKL